MRRRSGPEPLRDRRAEHRGCRAPKRSGSHGRVTRGAERIAPRFARTARGSMAAAPSAGRVRIDSGVGEPRRHGDARLRRTAAADAILGCWERGSCGLLVGRRLGCRGGRRRSQVRRPIRRPARAAPPSTRTRCAAAPPRHPAYPALGLDRCRRSGSARPHARHSRNSPGRATRPPPPAHRTVSARLRCQVGETAAGARDVGLTSTSRAVTAVSRSGAQRRRGVRRRPRWAGRRRRGCGRRRRCRCGARAASTSSGRGCARGTPPSRGSTGASTRRR